MAQTLGQATLATMALLHPVQSFAVAEPRLWINQISPSFDESVTQQKNRRQNRECSL